MRSKILIFIAFILIFSCSTEVKRNLIPKISSEPTALQYNIGLQDVGQTVERTITIYNIGTGELKIYSIKFQYDIVNPDLETEPALQLVDPGISYPYVVPTPESGLENYLMVRIKITRYDDSFERHAKLIIECNDPENPTFEIPITVSLPTAKLKASPTLLDLGMVSQGQTKEGEIILRNVGDQKLEITGFKFSADNDNFVITFNAQKYSPSKDDAPITFDDPLVLEKDQSEYVKVAYTAEDPTPAKAHLLIFSNDPEAPEGTLIEIQANQEGVCISTNPNEIDFGGRIPGQKYILPLSIQNCSANKNLEIYSIDFVKEGSNSNEFSVEIPSELLSSGEISESNPLIIPPNQEIYINVAYEPEDISPTNDQGKYIKDEGVLVVKSNAFESEKIVNVYGYGIPDDCPTAVISVDEGEEVVPQTVLHLHGEGSYAPSGNIVKYTWSVEQPPLSASVFVPSASYPSPTFEANVAGIYIFKLVVEDEFGRKSCNTAEFKVSVIPTEAIHVELLWHTPNDPDETDEGPFAGSDLDLHFAHPNASQYDLDGDGIKDPWFDPIWDCFWFYPTQNWGSATSKEDDPRLDRDDTDGAGPENMNVDKPEEGVCYRIGVNYWDDHGYGAAFATVRVYIYSQKVFEIKDVKMFDHDMWWVANLCWNQGNATIKLKQNAQGGYWITHDYHHPLFYQP